MVGLVGCEWVDELRWLVGVCIGRGRAGSRFGLRDRRRACGADAVGW